MPSIRHNVVAECDKQKWPWVACEHVRQRHSHPGFIVNSRTAWLIQIWASQQLVQIWIFVNNLISIKSGVKFISWQSAFDETCFAIIRDMVSCKGVPLVHFVLEVRYPLPCCGFWCIGHTHPSVFFYFFPSLSPFSVCSHLIFKRTTC